MIPTEVIFLLNVFQILQTRQAILGVDNGVNATGDPEVVSCLEDNYIEIVLMYYGFLFYVRHVYKLKRYMIEIPIYL